MARDQRSASKRFSAPSRSRKSGSSPADQGNARVLIVAIAGGSGSGKTWLARALQRRLARQAGIVSLDDFYCDLSHLSPSRRTRKNFDHPAAIDWPLFETCLGHICSGSARVLLPSYDFNTHTRRARVRYWRWRPVVLLEGLWPLWQAKLRKYYALSIYRECPEDLRFRRRLERDLLERGRSHRSVTRQYRRQVAPMHEQFVRPQAKVADLVLEMDLSQQQLANLAERIRSMIRTDY